MSSPPRERRADESSSSYPPPPATSSRLYIEKKAKEILETREDTRMIKFVTSLCYEKESDESSKLLYKSFQKHFPNQLAVKLLHAYVLSRIMKTTIFSRSSVRFHSLKLLYALLIDLEKYNIGLNPEALEDIQGDLELCLLQRETSDRELKLLSRIVSSVSVKLFIESKKWSELCFSILYLNDDKKTLLMFSELPTVLDEDFLNPLLENNLEVKIVKGLFDQDRDDEEWCLALKAGFSLMLQLINLERRDLVWDSIYAIVNSVWEMVNVRRREMVVRKGLLGLVKKVRREALRFREPEYEFVSRLVLMIKRINGVGKVTLVAVKMILDVLDRYYMGGKGVDMSFVQRQTDINSA